MRNNAHKFYAFIVLVIATFTVMMTVIIVGKDGAKPVVDLVDKWQNGIIGILGMAAGLLFRTSQVEDDTATAVKTIAANSTTAKAENLTVEADNVTVDKS